MGKSHSKVLPNLVTTALVPTHPAPPRSTAEQAALVAQITRELVASGVHPAAVVVNDTSTAILLPAGASQPIALPINFSATAQPRPALQVDTEHEAHMSMMRYAASPETVKTLKHAGDLFESEVPPAVAAGAVAAAPSMAHATGKTVKLASPVASPVRRADEPLYELFVSHCKRTESSEDRAIWVSDIAEGDGLSVFFDRSDLTQISKDKLKESVEASRVLVTILDPYTFDSDWVTLENEWARDAGIPVVGMYDGDKFRWEQIGKWKDEHPHVFDRPIINYQKDYRVESKKRLLSAVRDAAKEAKSAKGQAAKASAQKAAVAAAASPGKKKSSTSLVRIAVGKSTHTDPTLAVEKAYRHLISKLGGYPPHMCVVAFTGKHDSAAIAAALAKTVAAGTAVAGVSAGFGIMFEDQWISSADGK